MPANPAERLKHIYNGWQKTARRTSARRTRVWDMDAGMLGMLLALGGPIILITADSWLIGIISEPDGAIRFPISNQLALSALGTLFLLNSVLLDRFLAVHTRDFGRYANWVYPCRFLLVGIPIWGLFTVPLWSWLEREQPACLLKKGPEGFLARKTGGDRIMTRTLVFWQRWRKGHLFISLFLVNFIVLAIILNQSEIMYRYSPSEVPWFIAVIWCLHALTAISYGIFVRSFLRKKELARVPYLLIALSPIGMLLPIPLFGLLMLITLVFAGPIGVADASETHVEKIFESQRDKQGWNALEFRLRQHFKPSWFFQGFRRQPESWAVTRPRSLRIYWVKGFVYAKVGLLALEVAPLGWFVSAYLAGDKAGANAAMSLLWLGVLFLGCLGLVMMLVNFLRRVYQPESYKDLPFPAGSASYLAASQFAAFAGMTLGLGYVSGESGYFVGVFLYFGMLGSLVNFSPLLLSLPFQLPSVADGSQNLIAIFLFTTLAFFGLGFLDNPPDFNLNVWLYALFYLVGPFVGVVLGEWLLRPLTWRRLLNDLGRNPIKAESVLLAVTVIMPFGGLFAPWWINRINKAALARTIPEDGSKPSPVFRKPKFFPFL